MSARTSDSQRIESSLATEHLVAKKKRLRNEQLEIAEREARVILRRAVLDGSTFVTFGAGLDIRHIVCGYESRFLTIKNLPQNVQHSEVEELLTQLCIDHDLFHIVAMRTIENEVQAKVLSDSEVGQAIAAGLTGIEFRDGHYLDIAADNGPAPKRNINVLTVAWTLPSSTMVAQYSTSDAALAAMRRLNNTMFRRRKIRVEWYRNPELAYSSSMPAIKISGLPLNTTPSEVEHHSSANKVLTLAVLPGYNLEQIVEQIKGFEAFEMILPSSSGFNAEVRFQFRTWDDAKTAQNCLKGWKLGPDYPPLHVWLPMPIQYITVIPTPQYGAQKRLWNSMPVETDNNKMAFIRIINNRTEKTIILVLGEDKKAVGQLKVRVEILLAGEVLDWRLWHRSFITGPGRDFLERVSTRTKAYIQVDSASKVLKLYADGDIKQTVIELINAAIVRLERSVWSLSIPPSTTEFFILKGLPTLKEELGEDAAKLVLHPPRLIIRGGEEAHRRVDRLIEESQTGIECFAFGGENDACPSCYLEVSAPVLLSCGHVYCAECLRHFLSSAAERKVFPLICSGNGDRCRAPVAIPVIRRFLLQQQFDQLVEAAVKAYIEKQPNEFRYCVTPGCIQTYRCGRNSKTLMCPSCLITVCTSCHKEAHKGMTCNEKGMLDSLKDARLNDEWARGAGAKRCPSCRVWIQKTEGCNHMTCRCGAHICWNCLKTFSRAQDVYNHMRAVHGGIHVNNVQPARRVVTRIIEDQEIRRLDGEWIELVHVDNLDFACEDDWHVQDQAERQHQLQPHIRWQRLRPLRRLMQAVYWR